jgi:predicted PurR-regulated permease PerM
MSSSEYQPQLSLWVRQLLTILMVAAGLYLLTLTAPVLPMLTIAFLMAFVISIPSRALARRTPIPYAIAVILLYTLLIIVFVLGVLLLTPSLVSGVNNLLASLQQGYTDLIISLQSIRPADAVLSVLGVQVNLSDVVRTTQGILLNGAIPRTTGFLLPSQIKDPMLPAQQLALGSLIDQILPLFGSVSQTVTAAIGSVTGFVAASCWRCSSRFSSCWIFRSPNGCWRGRFPPSTTGNRRCWSIKSSTSGTVSFAGRC